MKICERCGNKTDVLYPYECEDEDGTKQTIMICWDCDFELNNGRGEIGDDEWEINEAREEEDYEYDPVYYLPPKWMLKRSEAEK